MNIKSSKQRRIRRVRGKIRGTADRLRLSVCRTNLHVYAQIIDDVAGKTLAAASDMDLEVNKGKELVKIEKGGKKSVSKVEIAGKIGELIAEKAKEMKILRVVFDRGPYTYHGRVRAVAEGARKGGLSF